jgi:anthranilate phosphoribosyltransferase
MSNRSQPHLHRAPVIIPKEDVQRLYSRASRARKHEVLSQLGPLEDVFAHFVENEERVAPLAHRDLITCFNTFFDSACDVATLVKVLKTLAPGNGQIGFRQVLVLVDELRKRVARFIENQETKLDLVPHDHAFGSGGDFSKTLHATTAAAILVAPRLRICKTGTTNVTALHGSSQAMEALGYDSPAFNVQAVNAQLIQYGFAFVALGSLGFPYSPALRAARKMLWEEATTLLQAQSRPGEPDWQRVFRDTSIPLDLLKIVSPNAQVLHPRHHSTGVAHLRMLPYVLGIYLHLGSEGIIVHGYDGIDEFSTASSDPSDTAPVNVLVKVEQDQVVLLEIAPEDLGLRRAPLAAIGETALSQETETFWQILTGAERGPRRDFVVANGALLLVAGEQVPADGYDLLDQLHAGVRIAERLIDSGVAAQNFQRLLGVLAG